VPKVNSEPGLFEASAKVPDGFVYRENFISESEERTYPVDSETSAYAV
jgi:hypothetical protein